MKNQRWLVFLVALASTLAFQQVVAGGQVLTQANLKKAVSCFPESQRRPIRAGFVQQGIGEEQFHSVLDRVAEVYEPIFARQELSLKIVRLWEDPEVNAKAVPTEGRVEERNILMFGGLARHEDITEDAFALVACHEIGHHLGGASLYRRPIFLADGQGGSFAWRASNEGQSDYFATLKCARKIFAQDDNVALMERVSVPAVIREQCAQSFNGEQEEALCQRSALAGISLGKMLSGRFGQRPDLTQPDLAVVSSTQDGHPRGQCRADTYFQGAVCHVSAEVPLSREDPEFGACTRRQGDLLGLRPLCWYSPETPLRLAAIN